ncbi:hypothetical protein KAX06_07780 [candidate division WOR-3 bacterium]|nr:hypothetical protein [candidate division WOR-3 bacterium]
MSNNEERDRRIGLRALPHLIQLARERKTITYMDLMKHLQRNGIRLNLEQVGGGLGFIRDRICIPRELPLINAIVVNKNTQRPSNDFLPRSIVNPLASDPDLLKRVTERLIEDVFANAQREEWDNLLTE